MSGNFQMMHGARDLARLVDICRKRRSVPKIQDATSSGEHAKKSFWTI